MIIMVEVWQWVYNYNIISKYHDKATAEKRLFIEQHTPYTNFAKASAAEIAKASASERVAASA